MVNFGWGIGHNPNPLVFDLDRNSDGEPEKEELEALLEILTEVYTLHPTPCTLHPTHYTLYPAPYTLHLTPYTLHPTHGTIHPLDRNSDGEPEKEKLEALLEILSEVIQGSEYRARVERSGFQVYDAAFIVQGLRARTL